jgi:hypothetical protein
MHEIFGDNVIFHMFTAASGQIGPGGADRAALRLSGASARAHASGGLEVTLQMAGAS